MNFIFLYLSILFVISTTSQQIPSNCCSPSSTDITIIDDASITSSISTVRENFLSRRDFKQLNVQLFVEYPNNVWKRGMVNGDEISYPASTVKLNYFVSSMHWCLEKGKSFDCLDRHVRPMIVYSSNFETGIVVDTITGAPNIFNLTSYEDPRWQEWYDKRLYTENFLKKYGYVKNQVIRSKTYPSNSAWPLEGAEKLMIDKYGKNMMNPCCAGAMMMDIFHPTKNGFVPEDSLEYSKQLLYKSRDHATMGYGIPPGSLLYSKGGLAYDTLEDIAMVTLPNKQRFLVSVYSDAFQRIWDSEALSIFVEMMIDELDLNKGGPPKIVKVTSESPSNFEFKGKWKNESKAVDKMGSYYFTSNDKDAVATLSYKIEDEGLYEVAIYNPTISEPSTDTKITIYHQFGNDTVGVDQVVSSRYSILGLYNFKSGTQKLEIMGNSESVIVNSIKLTKYPICDGVPGTYC